MIYKYNKGHQDVPLRKEHTEIILTWKALSYPWIIAEMFHINEELEIANPSSCMTLVCVACVFDRHRFGKNKQVPQNDALRKIHVI